MIVSGKEPTSTVPSSSWLPAPEDRQLSGVLPTECGTVIAAGDAKFARKQDSGRGGVHGAHEEIGGQRSNNPVGGGINDAHPCGLGRRAGESPFGAATNTADPSGLTVIPSLPGTLMRWRRSPVSRSTTETNGASLLEA